MDLEAMKYADLRQLAKSFGLKTNMKADKLRKAIKQHFEEQKSTENGNAIIFNDTQIPDEEAAKPEVTKDALVTTRRGKKQKAKRKYSGDKADLNLNAGESLALDDAKSSPGEEKNGDKRCSKRRKVSSVKDTETPAPEVKAASADENTITKHNDKDVVKKTAGKIPRHEGLMKKKAVLRPTTPNFKKLHEAHFNKMESIDSYMQRRNKQMEVLRNSVKDLKAQAENVILVDSKTCAKPPVSRTSLFSPGVQTKKAEKPRGTRAPASKPAIKDSAPFRPSILSANKISVRFSQTTQDNEHKRSLVKTPSRMSPMIPFTPTPGRKSEVHSRNVASQSKTPGLSPFVFSGTSDTPGTNKKNVFDLKASLSRPLTYKPHKGKLKPFGATQENAALNKSQTLPSHQKNYKQHQVQTRDERRVQHKEDRKQKKEKMLGARRGLVMN